MALSSHVVPATAAPFVDPGNMLLVDRVEREFIDKKKGYVQFEALNFL